MDRKELVAIVQQKGMDWAVAAMVDGSIGYHSPDGAKQMIEALLKGEQIWGCERTYACFKGDALAEIEHDFKYFMHMEKIDPETVKRLCEVMKKLHGLSTIQQWTFSAAYPTLNL